MSDGIVFEEKGWVIEEIKRAAETELKMKCSIGRGYRGDGQWGFVVVISNEITFGIRFLFDEITDIEECPEDTELKCGLRKNIKGCLSDWLNDKNKRIGESYYLVTRKGFELKPI